MGHHEVFRQFTLYFPDYAGNKISAWYPNGKSSVRIRQTNGTEFIFTFYEHGNWMFETVGSFLKERG